MSHGAREHVLMAKLNPFEFIQEVRQEVSKVTWPTWKEVWITTLMVLVMVTLAAIFFRGPGAWLVHQPGPRARALTGSLS
jgi:preprotein translocase subunit SecE